MRPPLQDQIELVKGCLKLLWSILTLFPRQPVLNTITTSHFPHVRHGDILLSTPPYNYVTLVIGLFGLIGVSTTALGPLSGRYVVQSLAHRCFPWPLVSPSRLLALLSAQPPARTSSQVQSYKRHYSIQALWMNKTAIGRRYMGSNLVQPHSKRSLRTLFVP